ncbi:hypothetical protein CIHG_02233 [Coccidioides immitis H538.4]|uniref:Uncharacterized protein n=1 Tax=Coccidioides immitis H538.4 TaxID=396776 RepID=A0A0J8UBG3_COCIT|nr:hypothetical protein CIHG_02233 [Coccidioides immitis H538.4]
MWQGIDKCFQEAMHIGRSFIFHPEIPGGKPSDLVGKATIIKAPRLLPIQVVQGALGWDLEESFPGFKAGYCAPRMVDGRSGNFCFGATHSRMGTVWRLERSLNR